MQKIQHNNLPLLVHHADVPSHLSTPTVRRHAEACLSTTYAKYPFRRAHFARCRGGVPQTNFEARVGSCAEYIIVYKQRGENSVFRRRFSKLPTRFGWNLAHGFYSTIWEQIPTTILLAKFNLLVKMTIFGAKNDQFSRFSTLRAHNFFQSAGSATHVESNISQRCLRSPCTNFGWNQIKIDKVITDFLTIF